MITDEPFGPGTQRHYTAYHNIQGTQTDVPTATGPFVGYRSSLCPVPGARFSRCRTRSPLGTLSVNPMHDSLRHLLFSAFALAALAAIIAAQVLK